MSAWIGWAALVVAVVAIPVTVWATRKWGNRNARLDLSVTAAAILPNGVKPGPLAVTYRDLPVDDPHLVTVALTNAGPRDLTSAHFDGAKPFVIRSDRMFYGVTESAGNPQISSPGVGAAGAEATVCLRPALPNAVRVGPSLPSWMGQLRLRLMRLSSTATSRRWRGRRGTP